MAERQTGLRFDIYERVHLAENTVGVRELDEVELVPYIQVYTEGDEAQLKGNLYLTGKYAGETGEESRTLEHLIPVEITLPLNRIQDVSQVAVEIDNFDVDLLTPRSLNVTGVLTLHGIEMLSFPEESLRDEGEEEVVFVHQAEPYGGLAPAPQAQGRTETDQAEPAASNAAQPAIEPAAYKAAVQLPAETAQQPAPEPPLLEAKARKKEAEEDDSVTEVFVETAIYEEDQDEGFFGVPEALQASTAPQPEPATAAPEPAPEEKKELKIAFGSKPAPDSAYHLKSLIHKEDIRTGAPPPAAEPAEEAQVAPRTDALEWKRLFVRNESGENQFKRVRVCIVQKDETLEAIAQRYSVQTKEILLYNGLTDQNVTEGKALLIPR